MHQGTDKIQDFIRQASSHHIVNTLYYMALVILTLYCLDNTYSIGRTDLFFELEDSFKNSIAALVVVGIMKALIHLSKKMQSKFTVPQLDLLVASGNTVVTFFLVYHLKVNVEFQELARFLNSFLPMTLFVFISPLTWRRKDGLYYGFFGFLEWSLLISIVFWLGFLFFSFFSKGAWGSILSNLIILISPYFIAAISRKHIEKLREKMHKEIYIDPLTKISNRKHFYDFYDRIREKNKALPLGELGLCVIFIDIDHFKQYNDHYGHDEGDKCLLKVARFIRELGEELGLKAFRYGGEEFLLCGFVDKPSWHEFLENEILVKWRDGRLDLGTPHVASKRKTLTLSGGVNFISSEKMHKTNAAGVVVKADENLYISKENGRNTVTW